MNLDDDPQKKEWLSLPDCPVSCPKLSSFVDSGDGLQWGSSFGRKDSGQLVWPTGL